MRFIHLSSAFDESWRLARCTLITVFLLSIGIAMQASAVLLFHDDFEKDKHR